jgi:Domain of unknown function (DUF5348)
VEEQRFRYNWKHHQLQLQEKLLSDGDLVEVCVLGHWLVGSVALDSTGWYLLTTDQIGIRLQQGMLARFPVGTLSIQESHNGHKKGVSS